MHFPLPKPLVSTSIQSSISFEADISKGSRTHLTFPSRGYVARRLSRTTTIGHPFQRTKKCRKFHSGFSSYKTMTKPNSKAAASRAPTLFLPCEVELYTAEGLDFCSFLRSLKAPPHSLALRASPILCQFQYRPTHAV